MNDTKLHTWKLSSKHYIYYIIPNLKTSFNFWQLYHTVLSYQRRRPSSLIVRHCEVFHDVIRVISIVSRGCGRYFGWSLLFLFRCFLLNLYFVIFAIVLIIVYFTVFIVICFAIFIIIVLIRRPRKFFEFIRIEVTGSIRILFSR